MSRVLLSLIELQSGEPPLHFIARLEWGERSRLLDLVGDGTPVVLAYGGDENLPWLLDWVARADERDSRLTAISPMALTSAVGPLEGIFSIVYLTDC